MLTRRALRTLFAVTTSPKIKNRVKLKIQTSKVQQSGIILAKTFQLIAPRVKISMYYRSRVDLMGLMFMKSIDRATIVGISDQTPKTER